MSTAQRTDACVVTVDRQMAEVLRDQTLVVLEANHEYFEDLRAFGPRAQRALATIYRDAFAVLDALGWGMEEPEDPERIEVPMTAGHAEQLRRRRYELGRTNLDRFDVRDQTTSSKEIAELDAAITADRLAAQSLDRIVGARRPVACA